MNDDMEIQELARVLKAHEVELETAITISMMVDEPPQRAKLMSWLEQNPKATEAEICRKGRALAGELNA